MSEHLPEELRAALERATEEFCSTLVQELGIGDSDYHAEELVVWQGWGQRIRLNGGHEFDLVINNTYELQQMVEDDSEEAEFA